MIAYIKEPIYIDLSEYEKEVLDMMGVSYKDNIILEQKIHTHETSMNELFSEVFDGKVDIEYVMMGGKYCDFSINIYKRT